MIRLLSASAKGALAVTVALLALALLRWAPVHAEVPVVAGALPLGALAVVLAVVASLAGRTRPALPRRPVALAIPAALVALAAVVAVRGPGGLAARAAAPGRPVARLAPGPIDLIGADLAQLPPSRRWRLRWEGVLRAPRSGAYRLRAEGRGRVEMRIDGLLVLAAEGERFRSDAVQRLGVGPHRIEVDYERAGPGPRLRLAWSPPERAGGAPGARAETIPPRALGAERAPALWLATDALALLIAALAGALVLAVPWHAAAPPPAPTPPRRGELLAALAGYALLAIAMSWPLAAAPASRGVVDRPDGRLNAWILAWDVEALTRSPGELFQAPVFHPLPDALAFSENLLGAALLAAPALLAGGPVLGYNAVWLLSLAVSGLGADLLVRRVTGDRRAAFLAGALFAVGAHRWVNTAHLHAHATLFLPFALLAVDRFRERPTLGRGLAVGAALALQGLTSVYLGAITAVAVAVTVVLAWLGGTRLAALARLVPGALLATALLAPIAAPYFRMRAFQGEEFGLEALAASSATPESWAASGAWPYFELTRRHLDPDLVRDPLFPGLVPLLLGLAGLAAAPRRYRAAVVAVSAVAILLSLGPATPAYRWLHEHVVLFRGIRALSRFSILPLLGLAVMSGVAVAGARRAPLAALLLGLVEACNVPLPHGRYEPPTEAARSLAGRAGAVVYLPLGHRGDTRAMLQSTAHFRPLVNGDSGFIPRPYARAMEVLERPEEEEALRFLRAVGVADVVARRPLRLPERGRFGEERVYAVPEGAPAEPPPPAALRPTLWSQGGAVVDLGNAEEVARVSFEMDERPWVAEPWVRLSLDGIVWDTVTARASLADAALALYRDPRHGRGELRFEPRRARFLALDPRLPARPAPLGVGR